MFKPTQSTYPMQSPKVAAMQQFIDRHHHHNFQTFSPVVKATIQPYGKDLFLSNYFMDSQNQIVQNSTYPTAVPSFEANLRSAPLSALSIQSSPALLPCRHITGTSLHVDRTLMSPAV